MSFDVTAFTDYVNQQSKELLTASVTGAPSADLFEMQTGVKTPTDIHLIDTDVIFQTGGVCSRTASGTTTFTSRQLVPGKFQVAEDLCPKELESKWTSVLLKGGSKYEDLGDIEGFAQFYFDKKAARIASQLETALYQGNTASGDSTLDKFDGILKAVDADATVVSATPSTINTTNIRAIMRDMKNSTPDAIRSKDDLVYLCGWDTFDTYIDALAIDNLYHKSGEGGDAGEMTIENTRLKLKAVDGLTGTNRILGLRTSNVVIGVDADGEQTDFEVWYSQDDRNIKFNSEWKYCVQYAFGSEIVEYTNV